MFSKYYFKTDIICLIFLSSPIFTALKFDSDHFDILLWKINPRDHNEFNHQSEKYQKTNQTLFCDVLKIMAMLICKESLRQL